LTAVEHAAQVGDQGGLDLRPVLKRGSRSVWATAERCREQVYEALSRACQGEGVSCLLLRSNPYEHPASVLLECWVPGPGEATTERASLLVTLGTRPYHTYEIEYNLEITDRGRSKAYRRLWRFPDELAVALVRRLLRRGRMPSLKPHMLRSWALDLGKRANRAPSLRRDWLAAMTGVSWVVAVCTYGIGLALAVPLTVLLRRRDTLVRSPDKPAGEPRLLTAYDRWHVVVAGIGADWQAVRQRFLEQLRETAPLRKFSCEAELVWHRGLDDVEEREQFVLRSGRGILYCQVYQYGDDLYVGWDSYLNIGQWKEEEVARGIDRQTGRFVVVNSLVPGFQLATEYDAIDLSCLSEWTHAQLVRLLTELIAERKIDQEIDFTIVRGERQGLPEAPGGGHGKGEHGSWVKTISSTLQRTS